MAVGGNSIARLFVTLGADISEFERKMDRAGRQMKTTGKGFTDMGMQLTRAITIPLAIISGVALKMAIDFESAFAGVRKTVNATEAEFEGFRRGILDMSKELPASANEIAGVAEAAGQLGIKNEALLDFTRTMIDLGETTNMSAAEAATALARLANIMQTDQSKFSNLGSVIVELGNNLATTEQEIVTMSLRLAGAAKQIGLTEAETLGFAAALSSVGIRADAGGTAFSKVFIEISKSVALGSKTLETFAATAGMSIDEFKEAFEKDAAGAVLSFVEGLGRIEEEGGNLFVVLDQLGIQERRMIDALLRTANAGDVVRRSLKMASDEVETNTALTEEAGKRYETTASQIEMAKNQAVAAAIAIGDNLTGSLKAGLVPLSGFFEGLEDLAKGFAELPAPVRILTGLILGLAGGIPILLTAFGMLLKAIPLLVAGFNALTAAVIRTNAVLLANPIVAIIAGLVAVFGTFFYQVNKARKELEEFERQAGITARTIEDQSEALKTWSKQTLLARKAMLGLQVAQAEAALSMERMMNAAGKNPGGVGRAHDLLVELTQLKAKLEQTETALLDMAAAEGRAGKKGVELADELGPVGEIYKKLGEDIQTIAFRSEIMGKEFNANKEEIGLLEEALVRLREEGVEKTDAAYAALIARLAHLRQEIATGEPTKAAPPSTGPQVPEELDDPYAEALAKMERTKARMAALSGAISGIISQGIGDAVSAFAEGLGKMAAGQASLGDVFKSVMMVLGDVAIRIGKVAIATGIGMIAIKKAFSNPFTAIAAGVALVALGSWVKSSIGSTMSGGGGGGGGGFSGPGENTSIGNYDAARIPNERDYTRSRRHGDAGSRSTQAAEDARLIGQEVARALNERGGKSVEIIPKTLPSGDINYSIRESERRAERRGTEVF